MDGNEGILSGWNGWKWLEMAGNGWKRLGTTGMAKTNIHGRKEQKLFFHKFIAFT